MYNLISNNDFVYTSRYLPNGGSDDDTIVTFIGNKFFSKLGNLLFSLKINDILYTFLMEEQTHSKNLILILMISSSVSNYQSKWKFQI